MSRLRFTIKPAPVFPEHRPFYKIAQLLLILLISSRGGKSSLARLQLFNWALKTKHGIEILHRAAETGRLDTSGWGFDPAVPIALRYAAAENLIQDVPTGYVLTAAGESFTREFMVAGLLAGEIENLTKIAKKITEAMMNEVARKWEG